MKSYIYNFRKLGTKKHKNEELSAVTSCRNASDEAKLEVEVAGIEPACHIILLLTSTCLV